MKKSSNFPSHTTSDSHLLTKNLPSKISHCCPRWHGNSPTWKALEVLWANQYDPRANSLKAIANCIVRQAQIFYFDIIFLTWQVTTAIISTILWTGVPHIVGNKPKGWISKLVFQENKARQIFRKTNISYPLIRTRTYAYQGVRNFRFFGKFGLICFLETPVLRFSLLPSYRRYRHRSFFELLLLTYSPTDELPWRFK